MTDKAQHREAISRIFLRAVAPALALALMMFAAPDTRAQTFSVLYEFKGPPDGAEPSAPLILDGAGNLYGTTSSGGDFSCDPDNGSGGCGTVFKLDKTGKETILHVFANNPDGEEPTSGLLLAGAGSAYGTTYYGGTAYDGTVFKISQSGVTIVHSFTSAPDGSNPYLSGLVRDATGNLFGTTSNGGKRLAGVLCVSMGCGTVFGIDSAGHEKVLYRFTDSGGDGSNPEAGVILDSAGNLYGTTFFGGSACGTYGCGTIFKLTPSGQETVLYSFTGGADGANPAGNLIRDAAGNLYGTAAFGGIACDPYGFGCGAIFRLDTSGKFTVLHNFTGAPDGANPYGGLVTDAAGNAYGVTQSGGDASCSTIDGIGCGTVYRLDSSGTVTVLHSFVETDGTNPNSSLVRDAAGNFYGTAQNGGNPACTFGTPPTVGCGTVFKLIP